MLKYEELTEINRLGEETENEQEESFFEEHPTPQLKRYSLLPIIQTALCAALLLALLFFKLFDSEKYSTALEWYRFEMSQEIELPGWQGKDTLNESEDRFAAENETSSDVQFNNTKTETI